MARKAKDQQQSKPSAFDDSAVRELVYRPASDPKAAARDAVSRAIEGHRAGVDAVIQKLTKGA